MTKKETKQNKDTSSSEWREVETSFHEEASTTDTYIFSVWTERHYILYYFVFYYRL